MLKLAANEAKQLVRRNRRHLTRSLDAAWQEQSSRSNIEADVDLRTALRALKPADRELLAHRYLFGLTSDESLASSACLRKASGADSSLFVTGCRRSYTRMSSSEEFDRGLAPRLQRFADDSLDGFDPEGIVEWATAPRPQAWWRSAATAAASLIFVGAIATVGTLLSARDIRPAASTPPDLTSALPAPSVPDQTPASVGLTEDVAVAAARAASPQSADRPVVSARAGAFNELLQPPEAYEFSADLPPERWVWVVVLASGDQLDAQGTIVVIDYLDGRIYGVMDFRG